MMRSIACAAALVATAVALLVAGPASAATTQNFHATFHDVSFQNSCMPPIVFCGSGVVDGFGLASTVVRVTKNVPIPAIIATERCSRVIGSRLRRAAIFCARDC